MGEQYHPDLCVLFFRATVCVGGVGKIINQLFLNCSFEIFVGEVKGKNRSDVNYVIRLRFKWVTWGNNTIQLFCILFI